MLGCNMAHADGVRVGVLKFGTVNWELDVIDHHGLDRQNGIELTVQKLASKNATSVALQGGAVDIIVSDWIWVSRQRAANKDYVFVPYSLTVGALMVNPVAGIESLADFNGQKLGIAGGPVDKSWLILQAWSEKQGMDIKASVEPTFAAPPLLNKLALRDEIPAVLNFWHYTARLSAAGFKSLVSVNQMLPELGVDGDVPLLGWVFSEKWAQQNPEALLGFLRSSYAAKARLDSSDEEWQRIKPLTKADSDKLLDALKNAYRAGIPRQFGEAERENAARLFAIMAKLGGEKLVGDSMELQQGTFWPVDVAELN